MAPRHTKTVSFAAPLINDDLDTTLTGTFDVSGLNQVTFLVDYTYSAATTLTFTLTGDPYTAGTNFSLTEEGTPSSGAIALSARSYVWTTSAANADFQFSVPVDGLGPMTLTVVGASGDTDDVILVKVLGSVQ